MSLRATSLAATEVPDTLRYSARCIVRPGQREATVTDPHACGDRVRASPFDQFVEERIVFHFWADAFLAVI